MVRPTLCLDLLLFCALLVTPVWLAPSPQQILKGINTPRIVNGTDANINSIPFQISLEFYNMHSCGGAILNTDTILTAAHCLDFIGENHPISVLSVRVGSSYLQRDGSVYRVAEAIIHEQYNSNNYDFDIALLKLDRPLAYSIAVQPVQVATNRDGVMDNEMVQVSGWGRIRTGGPLADVLQSIRMPVLSQDECVRIFRKINPVTERMFCAGYLLGEGDSCNGDSGGPLVNDYNILYGLVSWGPSQCAIEGYTGVYTNVAYFYDWIMEHS